MYGEGRSTGMIEIFSLQRAFIITLWQIYFKVDFGVLLEWQALTGYEYYFNVYDWLMLF